MKDAYTFGKESEVEPEVKFMNENEDFVENESSATTQNNGTSFDPVVAARHRNIKCGLINTAISVGINAIPLVVDSVKNKKNGLPNKVNKSDVVRMAVSTLFPVLETVDAAFLNNKLSDKFHLKDIRNVTNMVMVYPAAHHAINKFVNKAIRKNDPTLVQLIKESDDATAKMWFGTANLITPYLTNKFTDSNLTFMQKLNSILPVPILGRGIRALVSKNPAMANAYDAATGLIRFTSSTARSFNNAARAKPNSTINKATSTISSVADTIGDVLGVSRGNIGYGGVFNNGGYNSRWMQGGSW